MEGYGQDPQASAAVLRDGWLHTGDLGGLEADGLLTCATVRTDDQAAVGQHRKTVR
jgi:fatty-acyl-CoA synthase